MGAKGRPRGWRLPCAAHAEQRHSAIGDQRQEAHAVHSRHGPCQGGSSGEGRGEGDRGEGGRGGGQCKGIHQVAGTCCTPARLGCLAPEAAPPPTLPMHQLTCKPTLRPRAPPHPHIPLPSSGRPWGCRRCHTTHTTRNRQGCARGGRHRQRPTECSRCGASRHGHVHGRNAAPPTCGQS